MRRPLVGLALIAGVVATASQQASTASNSLPESTAAFRATTVTGATAVSIDYTITASAITAVTATLQKTDLLTTTVTAAFGADEPVTCVAGLITILNSTTGLGEADYACSGFTERADRPRELTIRAS